MNRYGQSITWGAISAPHPFAGDCISYSLQDARTKTNLENEAGDIMAYLLHSRKAALAFEAEVNASTTNFLDLSAGAAVAVSTITTGTVLATECVEYWGPIPAKKTASLSGTWYPYITLGAGAMAGVSLNAFTPDQTAMGLLFPGGSVITGTYGLGPVTSVGIVHSLRLRQVLKISEDEVDPSGEILGAASHGYERMITLELVSTGGKPAVSSKLAIPGAPATAGGFVITDSNELWRRNQDKLYRVEAAWNPQMATS
jgi:hypothetical protein